MEARPDHVGPSPRSQLGDGALVVAEADEELLLAVSQSAIREQPTPIEDRAVPGYWERDLISVSKNSYVATLVERHSRYAMLIKAANKDTEGVVTALIKHSQKLPGEIYRSLTWGRGRACRPPAAEAGHRHRGLLLRSTIILAAGLE